MRARRSKDAKRRVPQRVGERELALASLFICFSLPRPVLCKLAQPGVLFYLRSSLWSSDLLLFYFCGLFPSLSFSHRHLGLLFPILPTFNLYAEYIMRNAGLQEAQAGIKIARRNINNLITGAVLLISFKNFSFVFVHNSANCLVQRV